MIVAHHRPSKIIAAGRQGAGQGDDQALAIGGRGGGEALDRHWRMIGHARHAGHGERDAAMIGLQRLGKAQGQPGRLGDAGIGGGAGRNELRPGEGAAGQGGQHKGSSDQGQARHGCLRKNARLAGEYALSCRIPHAPRYFVRGMGRPDAYRQAGHEGRDDGRSG